MATFTLKPSLIKVLYDIQQAAKTTYAKADVEFLIEAGYLTNRFGGGWMITSKARELFRRHTKNPEFIAILRSDWPHELLAQLRTCEYNTLPNLPTDSLRKIASLGYLVALDEGHWGMTAKGRNFLAQYPE